MESNDVDNYLENFNKVKQQEKQQERIESDIKLQQKQESDKKQREKFTNNFSEIEKMICKNGDIYKFIGGIEYEVSKADTIKTEQGKTISMNTVLPQYPNILEKLFEAVLSFGMLFAYTIIPYILVRIFILNKFVSSFSENYSFKLYLLCIAIFVFMWLYDEYNAVRESRIRIETYNKQRLQQVNDVYKKYNLTENEFKTTKKELIEKFYKNINIIDSYLPETAIEYLSLVLSNSSNDEKLNLYCLDDRYGSLIHMYKENNCDVNSWIIKLLDLIIAWRERDTQFEEEERAQRRVQREEEREEKRRESKRSQEREEERKQTEKFEKEALKIQKDILTNEKKKANDIRIIKENMKNKAYNDGDNWYEL